MKSLVTLPVGAVPNDCSPGVYTKSGRIPLSLLASHFHLARSLLGSLALALKVWLSPGPRSIDDEGETLETEGGLGSLTVTVQETESDRPWVSVNSTSTVWVPAVEKVCVKSLVSVPLGRIKRHMKLSSSWLFTNHLPLLRSLSGSLALAVKVWLSPAYIETDDEGETLETEGALLLCAYTIQVPESTWPAGPSNRPSTAATSIIRILVTDQEGRLGLLPLSPITSSPRCSDCCLDNYCGGVSLRWQDGDYPLWRI